ncbi:hypothetical protein [Sinorhizobium alkalisoli]|uniref:hypothetical protein n=1 Tax=Sinorhizobium alkalisoli TaxID=1752398 RepID=UPI00124DFC4A|nr:hypothetical protein [Sinorhizobium alkalisoli]QFI68219.1 hypothetical protein EKH55_3345 [Sinorhizobium alkalisoli]
MLFEFIAALVAGVALAGIMMLIRWMSRGRLPRWVVPAAAGIGMLSYAVWSEYSWFARATNALPPGTVVTWKNESRSFWRPWSYYAPVVNRFTAVDVAHAQRHPNQPGLVMADLLFSARWKSPARMKTVFDCNGNRRGDLLGENVSVAEDGAIVGADWVAVPADDPALQAACRES